MCARTFLHLKSLSFVVEVVRLPGKLVSPCDFRKRNVEPIRGQVVVTLRLRCWLQFVNNHVKSDIKAVNNHVKSDIKAE